MTAHEHQDNNHSHQQVKHTNEHGHHHGNPFFIPFILILVFAVIEFYGGIWTKSLALLGDAWHMFSDVVALGLAMYAAHRVGKAKSNLRQSRAELIASILNAGLMLAVTVWIIVEAIDRLKNPQLVTDEYVIVIALLGLIVNLIVAKKLHKHEGEKGLNHQAAFLHVLGDILGSVAALAAGVVIYFTGWLPIDPILSLFISLLLLAGTFNLMKNIYHTMTSQSYDHGHHH